MRCFTAEAGRTAIPNPESTSETSVDIRLLFGRHPEPRLPGKVVESQSEVAFVHNEFLSSKLAQAYFFSGGEPMIRRQHSNKGFPVNGNNLDSFYFFDRQTQKPYIHGAILDHSDLITGEDIS
jgi:hypothetical protein